MIQHLLEFAGAPSLQALSELFQVHRTLNPDTKTLTPRNPTARLPSLLFTAQPTCRSMGWEVCCPRRPPSGFALFTLRDMMAVGVPRAAPMAEPTCSARQRGMSSETVLPHSTRTMRGWRRRRRPRGRSWAWPQRCWRPGSAWGARGRPSARRAAGTRWAPSSVPWRRLRPTARCWSTAW